MSVPVSVPAVAGKSKKHIKKLLSSKRISDPECISIYDIGLFVKQVNIADKSYKNKLEDYIEQRIKSLDSDTYADISVSVFDMNYSTGECEIMIGLGGKDEDLWFKKTEDGRVYISRKQDDYILGDKILELVSNEISDLYDYQEKLDFQTLVTHINPVNSKFIVDIDYYSVDIYDEQKTFSVAFVAEYARMEYDSETAMQLLKDNAEELYQKIFVKIDDCPESMREGLRKLRKLILEKEQTKETKKQGFWKKMFHS
jgi:hypothetical protein